jgi:hypothetical protein
MILEFIFHLVFRCFLKSYKSCAFIFTYHFLVIKVDQRVVFRLKT